MFRIALASLTLLAFTAGLAAAQGVQSLGDNPSANQLIEALTPRDPAEGTTPPKPLQTRGMQPQRSQSSAAAVDQRAPAVALNIKFALNSAELTPEARSTVKEIASAMKSEQLSSFRFRIEGHTDSTGRADLNLTLSERRAKAVRDELVTVYGVAPDRLQTVGLGQTQPLDPASPTSAVNRRVQLATVRP